MVKTVITPFIAALCSTTAAVFVFLSITLTPANAQKLAKSDYFFVLDTKRGLSDNCVLQMMQLPDRRLAVVTARGIDLYDGKRFLFLQLPPSESQAINGYDGQTHLYVDCHNRLWVKNRQQIHCIDLEEDRLIRNPLDSLPSHFPTDSVGDLFVDSKGCVWIVSGYAVTNTDSGESLSIDKTWGDLQDLDTDGRYVYTFHANGLVAAFRDGLLSYTVTAYPTAEAQNYRRTSLTVQTASGQFYQIRTGRGRKGEGGGSVFLHFDPAGRTYSKIYECDYILHTLNITSDDQALISSRRGYLMFDFNLGPVPREVDELSLPDGRQLTTGVNTVLRDSDGAIWLGTYRDGLIYVSPMLGLFFTIHKPRWQSWPGIPAVVAGLVIIFALAATGLHRKKKCPADGTVAKVTAECGARPATETYDAGDRLVDDAGMLVKQHLNDCDYGVEQLAKDLCMERTGLYKKLTSQLGVTPVAFIRGVRLDHAASLLREGRLSINEIAERTGFSSPSYFTKCFKKEFGVLPSEYR